MNWFKRLFRTPPRRPPQVHDFQRGRWGHNINTLSVTDDRSILEVAGWCQDVIERGDYVVLRPKARYVVRQIRYAGDPPDMFFARLEFVP
jgi:hypothetical protein